MKKYFLFDGLQQHGPFDLAELESRIITPQTLVWYQSLPDWTPASEIEELKNLLNKNAPISQVISPPPIKPKDQDWAKKQYFFKDAIGQHGPLTLDQLKASSITASTQVWYDPLPEWTSAEKIPGLTNILRKIESNPTPSANAGDAARQYYYLDNSSQKQGPFNIDELKQKLINPTTLVWYDPLPDWVRAGSDENLKSIVSNASFEQVARSSKDKQYYYDKTT